MNKHFCRCALFGSAALLVLLLGGCQQEAPLRTDFSMGERRPRREDDLLGHRERLANPARGRVQGS